MLNAMMKNVNSLATWTMQVACNLRRLRLWSIMGLAALAVSMSGCAMVRLGYATADELAYRWLDGWLDFNDVQSVQVRELLDDVHRWHRKTQLPDYAQWLARTAEEVMRDTTPEAVCKLGQDFTDRLGLMAERAAPGASLVALTLSDAQFGTMQKRFERSQVKFQDDYSKGDAKQREAAALERSVSRAESLYGKVDQRQREVLAQAAKDSPFDVKLQAQERQTRQNELMKMLRLARDAALAIPKDDSAKRESLAKQLRADFKAWEMQARQSPRSEYRAYQQRVTAHNCATSALVHNVASPATRQAARDKLKGYEADLRSLFAGS
jgi:hypothetical protein